MLHKSYGLPHGLQDAVDLSVSASVIVYDTQKTYQDGSHPAQSGRHSLPGAHGHRDRDLFLQQTLWYKNID